MQLGILKTGNPPKDLESGVLCYPAMVRTAFGPTYTHHVFDVANGNFPDMRSDIDAYVITGSASGVHDEHPWIARLRCWLEEIDPAIPLIGICFGHQIMAEAFGGSVETTRKGWALGLHRYTVNFCETWMDDVRSFVLPVSHRDQIVRAPPSSRVIATNDFCPYAALSYSHRRAVSFQAHPEFPLDYAAKLIDLRVRTGIIGVSQADSAKESMRQLDDCVRVMNWIRRFLEGARSDALTTLVPALPQTSAESNKLP